MKSAMIEDTYKILKLISGENIICELSEDEGQYEISRPLLMHVHPKMTMTGMTESLMLSRWVQPFTEERFFKIDPRHVIIVLPASPGLITYYEGVLDKLDGPEWESEIATSKFDDVHDEDVYDELLEELETESESIH
jgi:hypothetical protein|tara:strand:- start:82 stop:492 length:411 start_codon:yes stop_codon:yes gene_type:complete